MTLGLAAPQAPLVATERLFMKSIALRILLWPFTCVFYRITAIDPHHVPDKGGALLVSNHMSFADMVLILASTRRFVRFLLPSDICAIWWLKPFLRYLRVIP